MNPSKITIHGLIVWFVCALFFMYEFVLRTVLGTFQYPLMQDLALTPVKFALLSSTAYQVIYGLMQLPVGMIVDKFGLKKALLFAIIVCGVANLGFAFTHQFYVAVIFRVMMGLGSAFGFVCLLVAVYDWMPRKNIAFFIGLSQFIGTMGPMLAAGPLASLVQSNVIGWRGFFISLVIVAVVIAVLIAGFVENRREATGKFLILTTPASIFDSLKRLLLQKQIWFIAFYSASIYFSIEYLSENEGTSFLMTKGFSATFSSYMVTMAWLGYAICCPLLGFASDRIQRRKPLMILGALTLLLVLCALIYGSMGQMATTVCFFLLGFGASAQSLGFAIIAENCKESYLAVGLAVNNASIMLFAAINAPLMGYILARVAGNEVYGLGDYQHAFFLMVLMVLLALTLSTFLIKETFCKSMRETTHLHPTA